MKYILFDFNGTIVDDLDLSISCMNESIAHYLDRPPLTKEEYHRVFTFPVKDYYERIGFDFDVLDWAEVGKHWMDYYIAHRDSALVHEGIRELLEENHKKGYSNVVLSASKIENLKDHLNALGLLSYFDTILGIDNIYASSKLPIGLAFIKDKKKEDCIMIGDTLHDLEVASKMGIRCILVANGHQSYEYLKRHHDEVYRDIREVIL